MIDRQLAAQLIESALIADSYCLGLHWIYDHDLLDSTPLKLDQLNAPMSHWHATKSAGDLTHYGDQLWQLYQHLLQAPAFDIDACSRAWVEFMRHYHGYRDKASAITLDRLDKGENPAASSSTELSVSSRIACALLHPCDETEYLARVAALTRMTHNSPLTLETTGFLARSLWYTLSGYPLQQALDTAGSGLSDPLKALVQAGRETEHQDSVAALRHFGIACDIRHGLPGVIHLLQHFSNPLELSRVNVSAGGDSSARAMISLMLLVAEDPDRFQQLPADWHPGCLQSSGPSIMKS
ncbi:ADP-ribosylglycohydrolase family protein [Marinobacterium weihaiense]|uniref:ADP-ribosylglycohydrolase family protein n=1 Tax=Marinobacterium weihaiense TaxID=2851016 RepID=A0ABS6M6I4_9GAMM|nr:ADP-ribosylglycohydrolase family protein [Marinobacterium weihaiense]MBV0931887.1 ADP-ribosylglycohydrolase family protein [Marinobacterium weihaiense]